MDRFEFFGFFSKLLRLLLNVTEVTTEQQKWPKISTNSVKSLGPRPKPSELEVGPRSGLHLLVSITPGFRIKGGSPERDTQTGKQTECHGFIIG